MTRRGLVLPCLFWKWRFNEIESLIQLRVCPSLPPGQDILGPLPPHRDRWVRAACRLGFPLKWQGKNLFFHPSEKRKKRGSWMIKWKLGLCSASGFQWIGDMVPNLVDSSCFIAYNPERGSLPFYMWSFLLEFLIYEIGIYRSHWSHSLSLLNAPVGVSNHRLRLLVLNP